MRKKPVSPLTHKLLRDLRSGWKSFVAILIICAISIALYVGIDAAWRGMERNLQDQFERSDLADLWVKGAVTDRTVRDIAAIEGVERAQRRVTVRMDADGLKGNPHVLLLMNEGLPTISRPLVTSGEPLTEREKNQCVLQERFARAHDLHVGDVLRLSQGDHVLELTICGLGVLPEFVVGNDGGELVLAEDAFGYACVSPGTLLHWPYSEVAVSLKAGADLSAIRLAVEALVKDAQTVVSERKDIIGVKMATEQTGQIRSVGTIFPLVFFIIAVLITWTTMGRLVEKQRLQIGSLFAMGYSRGELILHFASYGLLLAVAGSLAGAGGAYVFGAALLSFLGAMYILPGVVPFISPAVMVVVSLIMVVITGGASMLSAITALGQTPSALLRPKPPGKGKRVFLERIGAVWGRMGFSSKMVLRNMLRNPVRLLMGMVGALGCTALMVTGFGLRDSMDYVMELHFTETMRYDARVTLTSDAAVGYGESIAARTGAEGFEEEMVTACEAFVQGDWRMKPVFVLQDGQELIRLADSQGESVDLPANGVALSRRAAEDYGLDLGDDILLRVPGGRATQTRVEKIVDLRLDQGIYLSRGAWEALNLGPWMPTAVLLRGDALNLPVAAGMDGVDKARGIEEERRSNTLNLQVMEFVVLMLVLFSGVLALVVFYNLGQLNLSERMRELATIKVLGFTPSEIKKLVLRENIIITIVGMLLGMVCGPVLHKTVLVSALPNTMQYVPYITRNSWIFTAMLTLAFAMLVNWMLGAKFKEVNMVESLKSVE